MSNYTISSEANWISTVASIGAGTVGVGYTVTLTADITFTSVASAIKLGTGKFEGGNFTLTLPASTTTGILTCFGGTIQNLRVNGGGARFLNMKLLY